MHLGVFHAHGSCIWGPDASGLVQGAFSGLGPSPNSSGPGPGPDAAGPGVMLAQV